MKLALFFQKTVCLVLACLAIVSCTKEPVPIAVTGVALNMTSMSLVEGDSKALIATVSPSDAENKEVSWSSSNPSVASVVDGVVTAIKVGTVTITVKTADGGKTAKCEVAVSAKVYPVTGVTLDKTSVEMTEGDEVTLSATVNPDNATNKEVTWSSSDTTVAVVANGKVTTLKPGQVTITVKTADGGKTAKCDIIVKAKIYPVTDVSLDKTSVEMTEGDEVILVATVNPENATNKNVTWSSSDTTVAVVVNGKVTALKPGQVAITVKTDDGGKTAKCDIIVKAKVYPVEGISLNYSKTNILVGDEMTLQATITPSNATNQNVVWSSSDPTVVSVDNGKIKALQLGSATITVTSEDGAKTATCVVSVVNIDGMIQAAFSGINISSGSMSFEGSYLKLTPGVKMNVALRNYSSRSVTLTGFAMICGRQNTRINYTVSETEVPGNKSLGYTVTLATTMYSPIAEFTYRYGSETYTVRVQYNGSF